MQDFTCKDQVHFIQHYHKEKKGYFALGIGHCVEGRRTKSRRPHFAVCTQFVKGKTLL